MVSYFKTQFFPVICAVMNIAFAIWSLVKGDEFTGLCWVISATVWLIMSFINYNDERIKLQDKRIKLLEAKAEKYDALAELVHTLYEANSIDRAMIEQLERRINCGF